MKPKAKIFNVAMAKMSNDLGFDLNPSETEARRFVRETRDEHLGVFDADDHSCLCLLNSDFLLIAKPEKTINYLSAVIMLF